MNQLKNYQKIHAWQQKVEPDAPKEGDLAPDFCLSKLDGTTTIRLTDYRGKKPVALVFGSHT